MRVAAIYDIHGNLPALEAVLQEIRQVGVDHVVVGGDVFPGPMPRETLARLLDLDISKQFILGNGDREVLALMQGIETGAVPEPYRALMRWNAQQLGPEDQRVIGAWPMTTRLEINGLGTVLFCHATPRSDSELFTRLTNKEQLLPVFQGLDVPIVICGHTHMQFDRLIGSVRVVNAGSVGMPFGEPGAYWLLLGPDIQRQHTPYDLTNAAQRIRNTECPQAQDFAAKNVLQPPTESEMIAAFARVELK